MKRVVLCVLLLSFAVTTAYCDAPVPSDKLKRTSLGKYSTATEAYEKWKANPDHVTIVDVRTPEEYVYVGHAPMALNLPVKIRAGANGTLRRRMWCLTITRIS